VIFRTALSQLTEKSFSPARQEHGETNRIVFGNKGKRPTNQAEQFEWKWFYF
jgi:hypothetical protein